MTDFQVVNNTAHILPGASPNNGDFNFNVTDQAIGSGFVDTGNSGVTDFIAFPPCTVGADH